MKRDDLGICLSKDMLSRQIAAQTKC